MFDGKNNWKLLFSFMYFRSAATLLGVVVLPVGQLAVIRASECTHHSAALLAGQSIHSGNQKAEIQEMGVE